ncbi:MAG TPA: DUF4956 domain-containing protein [Planctomycetota bacterium]|nr:DUF4956 domain-containing protein [Planctomycetota bacterium]HRR82275.1 DUF4956 domain-containing protein [Planctomycetota bacterium]HRT94977.1 DUF4956 domain-containing protein [Planctomycetota bacterium]
MDWVAQLRETLEASAPASLPTLLLGLLLAFVLGNVTAWTYMHTHTGLSYARSFVQSLVLLPVILAMAMAVVAAANSLVIAFGLMGAVAIVRFRTILKDTRDTAFLLLTLVIGLATGTGAFEIAVLGTVAICAITFLMHLTSFGSRQHFDVLLSFRLLGGAQALGALRPVLSRHCRRAVLASQRVSDAAGAADFSYRLLLRDPQRSAELAADLAEAAGVSHVSMIQRDEEGEV